MNMLKLLVIKRRVPEALSQPDVHGTCGWAWRNVLTQLLKHSGTASLTLGVCCGASQLRAEMDALQRALQADGRAPLAQTALVAAQLAALSAKHEDVLAQARLWHFPYN